MGPVDDHERSGRDASQHALRTEHRSREFADRVLVDRDCRWGQLQGRRRAIRARARRAYRRQMAGASQPIAELTDG